MSKLFYKLDSVLNKNKSPLLIMWVLIILSFILRVLFLHSNPIGLDEPFTIFHAQMDVGDIISNLKGGNNPPLFEIILHYWIKFFGISSFSVRFPSLIFSTINVAFVFMIAKKFINLKVAILATLLIAFSSYHIYFSHEARVYSLFALLTSVSFYLILSLIKEGSRKYYIWLFITYSFLIYSHYFGVFVIVMQIAIMIFYGIKNKINIKGYLIVIAGLLLIFSFYLGEFILRFTDSTTNGTWLRPVENLGNLHHLIFQFTNENKLTYLICVLLIWGAIFKKVRTLEINKYIKLFILGVIFIFFLTSYSIFFKIPFIWRLTSLKLYTFIFVFSILGLTLYILFKQSKKTPFLLLIILWFLIPLLSFFTISFYFPIFLDRYLFFILPAFYLIIATSVIYLFKEKYFYIIAALLLFLMIFSSNIRNKEYEGIKKTVEQITKLKQDSTKVIICPKSFKLTFWYHYNIEKFADYKAIKQESTEDNIISVYNSSELTSFIKPNDTHIILIDAHSEFLYPNNGIYKMIEESFDLTEKYEFKKSLVIYNFNKKQIN